MMEWTEQEWIGITAHYLGEHEMPKQWLDMALHLKREGYSPETAAWRMRRWLKIEIGV